jgi:hypothetical protein
MMYEYQGGYTMAKQIAVTITFCLLSAAWCTVINVPADQPTIQSGIDAASGGDTVLVASGIYYENIHFRKKGIVVASHFILDNNYAFVESTIINGGTPVNPDTASCVLMVSDTTATIGDTAAALIGFTLTDGTGTRWTDEHGAGIYREGGGIIVQYWSPRIYYNIIVNNEAVNTSGVTSAGGGAIRCGDANPRIMNNVIVKNRALYGGGIVLNFTGAIIKNNIIAYDSAGAAYGGGGGFWAVSNGTHEKVIENNIIAHNKVPNTGYGGGLRLWSTTVTLRNNIVWANEGQQIFHSGGGSLYATYNDVQGGLTGEGNIDEDPFFVDNNFHLSSSSLCIDAGDTNALCNDPEDPYNPGFAEWPSLGTVRNDMGSYGGPYRSVLPDVPTALTEYDYPSVSPGIILNNSPNPFRDKTSISFQIKDCTEEKEVILLIYDVTGRLIKTLPKHISGAQLTSHITWNGTDNNGQRVSAGVYLYELKTNTVSRMNKMMLLR